VESLRALLELAQEREAAARQEVAQLELQAAEALAGAAPAAPARPAGEGGGQAARRAAAAQKLSRLSQLCAAADQSLRLMSARLGAALGGAGGAGGGLAGDGRAPAPRRRSSVAATRRRTSLSPVRRMSAVGLVQQRGAAARASIAGGAGALLLPLAAVAPRAAAAPEAPGAGSAAAAAAAFFPHLPALVEEVGSGLDRVTALTRHLRAANAALQQAAHAASSIADEAPPDTGSPPAAEEPTVPAPQAAAAAAVSVAAGGPRDYKRATLAGPAWLDAVAAAPPGARAAPRPAQQLRPSVISPTPHRSSLRASFAGVTASPGAAQQAQQALARLVGHPADPPPPAEDDPFAALDSDDESVALDR
jgi:hypothetical protein